MKRTASAYAGKFKSEDGADALTAGNGKNESNKKRKLGWLRLDNAALIFPAALRKGWSNAYRISFTFRDFVDPAVLDRALARIAPRFPSVIVKLRRSFFWYYLEELPEPPAVREDSYMPLVGMTRKEIGKCAIRVLYYRNRMAVEYFHSVTDGTGALVFAKNLAAEYVRQRYGAEVPCEYDVKDIEEQPRPSELEDCFAKNSGEVGSPRDTRNVFRLKGEREPDGFLHVTCGMLDSELLYKKAKSEGVTVTAYVTAVLIESLLELQARRVPKRNKRKHVKVQIPVNLRKLYGGDTMRNFVAVANVGVDARMGEYDFDELVKLIHHQLRLSITPKNMSSVFYRNVADERNPLMKAVPLFLKNIVMRMVFDAVGETVSCLTLSNLGNVELPEAMREYVTGVQFVLGPQAQAPYNASMTSYGGVTYINIVRNSVEPELEREFFRRLVKLGFNVKIDSNDR